MTPAQCRAARALLNWSQDSLAAASGVSVSTIRNFERERRELLRNNDRAIERVFVDAGIEFMPGGARIPPRSAPAKRAK
jgi:transcriptional regulator with XRE-family HTH domain